MKMKESTPTSNLFVRKNQKDWAAKIVGGLMTDHLLYCVESGECQNFDNGVCTSCDFINLLVMAIAYKTE